MKVSVGWLKEYVDFSFSPEELAEQLMMTGTAVESITRIDNDTVIDFEITPNRPDCMSVIGVAREVAAITFSRTKMPAAGYSEVDRDIKSMASIEVLDLELCPRYIGLAIDKVKIAASPAWMQRRLLAAGMRPINNAVDVTNYVMLETGQPLHAFDLDKLADRKIIVRRAKEKEKIITLDGITRELNSSNLVIADKKSPVAIAGVMGSEDSEVEDGTKTILLESAYFNPRSVMSTARSLDLLTESASRFERGIDPNTTEFAAKRAISLLGALCGGQILRGTLDIYPKKMKPWSIHLRPHRVNAILGTALDEKRIEKRIKSLGLATSKKDSTLKVAIPTFRQDLEREIDLIEEIARLERFDTIASTLPENNSSTGGFTENQKLRHSIENILAGWGLHEVITYSFGHEADIKNMNIAQNDERSQFVELKNPLSEDQAILRTSLLPGLLRVARHNFSHDIDFVPVFETGKIFRKDKNGQISEFNSMGILIGGTPPKEWWGISGEADFFTLKGTAEDILTALNIKEFSLQRSKDTIYHPGASADILVEKQKVISFGELHPGVLSNFETGVKGKIYFMEIFIDLLLSKACGKAHFKEIPKFPSNLRDLAILAPEDYSHIDIEKLIKGSGGDLLESVHLFDLYKGENIPEDKKSLAYSLAFRAPDRTLTDDEIDKIMDRIIKTLEKNALSIRS